MVRLRYDAGYKIVSPLDKTGMGRYKVDLAVGTIGHKLPYFDLGGNTWNEWVSERGLLNDEYKASLEGSPIVLAHPSHGTYNLNAENLRVGNLSAEHRMDGKTLVYTGYFDDRRAVERIDQLLEQGIEPELSPGYSVSELIQHSDGSFEQIRQYNDHVAAPLSPGEGRGGQNIRLRFDSGDIAVGDRQYFIFPKKTMKLRIDGKTYDVEDEGLYDAASSMVAKYDTVKTENEALKSQLEAANGEKEGLKTKLDSFNSSKPTDDEVSTEVKARFDTWMQVEPLLKARSDSFKPDFSLSVPEIKELAVKVMHPDVNLDGKSNDYKEAYFNALVETGDNTPEATNQAVSRVDNLLSMFNTDMKKEKKEDKTPKQVEEAKKEESLEKIRDRYRTAHKKG